MAQYLIQMSGVPGSGKSTVARGMASKLHAIVLDHDDTKSAILSTGIEDDLAGQASYEVIKTLVPGILQQGFSVIIDSPCLYIRLLEFGQRIAAKAGVDYRYIECRLEDLEELNIRINARESKPSQARYGPLEDYPIRHQGKPPRNRKDVFMEWAANMKRPDDYLIINALEPPDICLQKALGFIKTGS